MSRARYIPRTKCDKAKVPNSKNSNQYTHIPHYTFSHLARDVPESCGSRSSTPLTRLPSTLLGPHTAKVPNSTTSNQQGHIPHQTFSWLARDVLESCGSKSSTVLTGLSSTLPRPHTTKVPNPKGSHSPLAPPSANQECSRLPWLPRVSLF